MAIKFEDVKPDKPAAEATAAEKARLGRGATAPTEAGSELPFDKPEPRAKKSRKR